MSSVSDREDFVLPSKPPPKVNRDTPQSGASNHFVFKFLSIELLESSPFSGQNAIYRSNFAFLEKQFIFYFEFF